MTSFKQIRALLQWVADYHAHLKDMYTARGAIGQPDERLRMALGYVAEHEEKMQEELQKYLSTESSHRTIVDTYFEEPVEAPDTPLLEKDADSLAADSVQAVLKTAMDSHKLLKELYDERARHAVGDTERELFDSLSGHYEAEIRRLVRNMQRLEDY